MNYFKSSANVKETGQIDLVGSTVYLMPELESIQQFQKEHVLQIITKNRTWYFSLEKREIAEEWETMILQASFIHRNAINHVTCSEDAESIIDGIMTHIRDGDIIELASGMFQSHCVINGV